MSHSIFARRLGLVVAGGGVYVGVTGLVYVYMTAGQADFDDANQQLIQKRREDGGCCNFSFVDNPERIGRFQSIADRYDSLIGREEMVMGMGLFRRSLLYWHSRGTVLEMAAGTGRNCRFYPESSVDRVVLTDSSAKMLQQAKVKVTKSGREQPRFAFIVADSQHLDFEDNTFDTVVDTFGLCSFDDPVAVLKEMDRVCKPDGNILLLEHGRSKTWDWITTILDKNAERHAKNWGCVHNRDLDEILSRSGLQLEQLHTWHFGTTYYAVCRPSKPTKAT